MAPTELTPRTGLSGLTVQTHTGVPVVPMGLLENQPRSSLNENSLMQQLSQAQRQYGIVRFPPKLLTMEGQDFVRNFIL